MRLPLILAVVVVASGLLTSGMSQEVKPRQQAKDASPAEPGADAKREKKEVPPGKEFVYKKSGGKDQKLEVYFPAGWEPKGKKVPGVLLFHGGGWGGGNLEQFRYACRYFASRGLVAATANYRMLNNEERAALPAGESFKRVCVTDGRSAIRWMKQHAEELGVDPQRIITGGGSAGGHISILASLNAGLDDPADAKEFDTKVVAYILFNPALGKDAVPDSQVDALGHLKADMAPALFLFGSLDGWKPASDAARTRLKELGNPTSQLWIAEGQNHGFFNRPPWQDVTIAQADRFLVEIGLLGGSGTLSAPPGGEAMKRQD